MKKLMLFVLSAIMVLSLCACGQKSSSSIIDNTSKPSNSSSSVTGSTPKSNSSSSKSSGSTYKSNSSSSKSKNNNSNYDYDKGYGYTSPKSGESLSDYIKRQDPELYNSIKDNYNNATKSYKKSK